MSTNKSIVNAYCVISAFFFAACAFAQLNDPDPVLWILGYLCGGSVFNVLVIFYHGGKGIGDNDIVNMLRALLNIFAVGNCAIVVYMMAFLIPRVDFSLPPRNLVWSVLEFEEGREIAGLALLFLHVLKLGAILREDLASGTSSDKDKVATSSGGGSDYVGTFAMAGALVGAVYLWVYYQPEMNLRYQTEHCDGQFGERAAEL